LILNRFQCRADSHRTQTPCSQGFFRRSPEKTPENKSFRESKSALTR
jgi:hypothetical protein